MKLLVNSIIGLVLFLPAISFGCFTPKPEQTAPAEILIKRTKNIYLAEVVGRLNGKVDFKVTEKIKGEKRERFQIPALITDEVGTDFNGHKLESFWLQSGGRGQIEPSCEITPSFQKGKKYLIFLDKPYHLKSFELINIDSDAWLMKVREIVKLK